MISKGQLKGMVWRYLGKSATQPGFYTSEKMDEAIEEALTYIAVEMFQAGDGWLTKYSWLDTVGGQTSIDIPGNVALIREVRYKNGDTYYPLIYDDLERNYSYVGTGVNQAWPGRYRILGRQIVFDPPLAQGGEKFLQLEFVYYPDTIVGENEVLDPQIDAVCVQFLKYKVASILSGSIEKTVITWADLEAKWEEKMKIILNRRVMSSTAIREFLP